MKAGHKTFAVAAITIAILGSTVLAGPGGGPRGPWPGGPRWQGQGPGPGGPGMMAGMCRRLDLSDEQTEKIRDITQQARTEGREAGRALAGAKEALNDAVADGAGEPEIREAAEALAQAIGNQAVHQIKTRTAIRAVLTDEQRERLEQAKERLGGGGPAWGPQAGNRRRWGGRGPGWGGPGGPRGMGGPGRQSMERPGRQGQRGRGMGRGGFGSPMGGRPGSERGRQFPERMFERADANDDGVLSKEELETFRQKRPSRPRSQR